jgi:hypothetical protein
MNRSDFLKSACAAATSVLFTNCASPTSAPVNSKAWPPVAYKTVRAFAYDCDAEHGVSFWKHNGRMHKGVLNAPGAVLSPSQVQRLVSDVVVGRPMDERKPCYVPHHAFVFYDAADKPVATLEICFTCRRFEPTPSGLPEQIGYDIPWTILKELNVPAERDKRFYGELYRKLHGKA